MNGPDNLLPSPIESAPVPEVINHTRFPSQYFQMIDTSDVVFHVMVTRMTYDLAALDAEGYPALAETQTELVASDEFIDQVNLSSVQQESDYAPYKPKCDLIFMNAVAYAPAMGRNKAKRKPLESYPAGVRIEFNDGTLWQKLLPSPARAVSPQAHSADSTCPNPNQRSKSPFATRTPLAAPTSGGKAGRRRWRTTSALTLTCITT